VSIRVNSWLNWFISVISENQRQKMTKLDPEKMKHLAAHVNYYREMGIYDFYRQPVAEGASLQMLESVEPVSVIPPTASMPKDKRSTASTDKPAALKIIREDIGDCTRCRLHERRTNIVFGVGNVNADIMFVGEGPGADEDAQGEPFVGRAGQLLNNMITAMGIKREDVYIANVVKCRPPWRWEQQQPRLCWQ
jgi:DNA polymerase